jgi:hypothetical protein
MYKLNSSNWKFKFPSMHVQCIAHCSFKCKFHFESQIEFGQLKVLVPPDKVLVFAMNA